MDIKNYTSFPDIFGYVNMNIYEFSYVRTGSEWHADKICSGYTRIYMVTKGSGRLIYDGTEITMTPGNIYIVPSGLEFAFCCDDYLEKLYAHICITGQNNYDIFGMFKKCIELKDKSRFINDCLNVFNTHDVGSIIRLKFLLYNTILWCAEQENTVFPSPVSYSEITTRALLYIENHLSLTLTTDKIAKEIFASSSTLKKQFQKDTGVSLGKYIDDRVMFKAEHELRRQEKSIKEISDMLGFCDQFYFSRKFKDKYKMSPLAYRKTAKDGVI